MNNNTLLIATHNKVKFQDIKNHLHDIPYKLVSLDDVGIDYDVEETGTTYEQNAILKAEAYAKLSGLLTLADDTGIEIDALGGEPGVYSARYAGPNSTDQDKISLILDNLKDVPDNKRGARFVVVLALVFPNNGTKLFKGEVTGHMARESRGILVKGFPYRQFFIIDGHDKTVSELDDQKISHVSHRHKALDELKRYLQNIQR